MQDISYQFLRGLVAHHFDIDADKLRPDTTFDELGMDSLALMELVVVLEGEIGIQIPDDLTGIDANAALSEISDAIRHLGNGDTSSGSPKPHEEQALPLHACTDLFGGSGIG